MYYTQRFKRHPRICFTYRRLYSRKLQSHKTSSDSSPSLHDIPPNACLFHELGLYPYKRTRDLRVLLLAPGRLDSLIWSCPVAWAECPAPGWAMSTLPNRGTEKGKHVLFTSPTQNIVPGRGKVEAAGISSEVWEANVSQGHSQPSWMRALGSHLAEGYISRAFLLKGQLRTWDCRPLLYYV